MDTYTEEETFVTNPREDWNLGIMACFHRRYRLGDKITDPRGGTITVEEAVRIEGSRTCPTAGGGAWEPCLVLPIYAYIHGGIAVSTEPFSCPWDSGKVGIIYAPYSRIRECYGRKRVTAALLERARRSLLNEVEEYDRYLHG